MLNYGSIRDLYKNADRINSEHMVIMEWNTNRYQEISKYGIYVGNPTQVVINHGTYNPNDSAIENGQNYLIYNDGTKKVNPNQEYFSDLASVFKPFRPDPGIILLQKFGKLAFAPVFGNLKAKKMAINNPRYYPFSENRQYDYFNSAKRLQYAESDEVDIHKYSKYGISNPKQNNTICNVSPFVVYKSKFLANKLVIKVQNHLCVPKAFYIQVLIDDEWVDAWHSTDGDIDFSTGILNLYYNDGDWSKTPHFLDDFTELSSDNPTQAQEIRGVRLIVATLTDVVDDSPGSLELIEISPRLIVDATSYTESFSFNANIGDSTLGLPVGSIIAGSGQITLSNENKNFLFASELSKKKMLNQDVQFTFVQKVYVPEDDDTYLIPMKTLFSTSWDVGEDYSVSVSLLDAMKFLQQVQAPDLLISSNAPVSSIILMILDNVGITGLEFKKSSNNDGYDKEDTIIKNFFCKKEQTVAEVLNNIAISTQCTMFYDALGNLNVLTKEKLTENASIEESDGTGGSKTDFWFVSDEDYTEECPEYLSASYTSNIASFNESKLNPVTDGDITYHSFGPNKSAMSGMLGFTKRKQSDINKLLDASDNTPLSSLAFSNYDYKLTTLWQPSQDNEAILWAVNIIENITDNRIKDIFTSSYVAYSQEDAIRQVYKSISNNVLFPTESNKDVARRSLIAHLDINQGIEVFLKIDNNYRGMFIVDNEYIKYNGVLVYIATPVTTAITPGFTVLFSKEEFDELVSIMPKNASIIFKGLVIDMTFSVTGRQDNKYVYKVIGDGRAKLGSKINTHIAITDENDDLDKNNRFKLMLGESKQHANKMDESITTTVKYNYADGVKYKSVKNALGTLPMGAADGFLGYLKVSGPLSPKADRDILSEIDGTEDANKIIELLNSLNKQVDSEVPGNFDDYIDLQGERNIYGQKITLPFAPSSVSTRMRLYSKPRNNSKDNPLNNVAATNSSIAGIGFGLNEDNEGYFLEVESITAKQEMNDKEKKYNNLRFYKVSLKDGKYTPNVLIKTSVKAMTTNVTSAEVIKSESVSVDPVFELDIKIEQHQNGMIYTIYYGDTKIGKYTEPIENSIGVNNKNIFLFVRNDSQAIYEYIAATARPAGSVGKNEYWKSFNGFNSEADRGIISVDKSFIFKDDDVQFYFNDFARVARQVKELELRFVSPAYASTVIDVSKVNPKYFVKKYHPTCFGAKITIMNISSTHVILNDSKTPLYITGVAAEEFSTGKITMKDVINEIEDDKKRVTQREKNLAIYGPLSFTLDSQYIQSPTSAKNLMTWIMRYCSRQRLKLALEVFPNPLIELGDKVKIFDKSRDYYPENANFGSKTFIVSSISHQVSAGGPTMSIELTEVGEN